MNMDEKIRKYAEAIIAANNAAKRVDKPYDDGGSCNLDTVVIDFTGWKKTDITKVAKLSGVSIGDKMVSSFWKGYAFVWTEANGQGFNRTRMVEAASKELRNLDIPASVWYQMD